jgi:polysaccharide biosynthesis protein PslH
MKILMVMPMPPRPQAPGAIPLVLDATLVGLRARHRVTLLSVAGPDPSEWDAIDQLTASGLEVHAVPKAEPLGRERWARRWRLARSWLLGGTPLRSAWYWEPGVQHTLDRLLASQRFDVVLLEDNAMGLCQVRGRVPTLLTEHEVRRPRPIDWRGLQGPHPQHWLTSELDWQRWAAYQRRTWRRSDRIQVFTLRDAQAACALAPELADRVRVNPFAVRLPVVACDPAREESRTLLFVGNFSHPPNVDAALWLGNDIMPLLRARCAPVRLVLVGPEAPESVRRLACADIHVVGTVPEIEPYFARAAVVLAPLRTGGGQRMKVLQGMALGKAVVPTPRGASGLAIGGLTPPLVSAETAEALVGATVALLDAPTARHELGRQARAYVAEHFSPEAYARRFEATCTELCAPEVQNRVPAQLGSPRVTVTNPSRGT